MRFAKTGAQAENTECFPNHDSHFSWAPSSRFRYSPGGKLKWITGRSQRSNPNLCACVAKSWYFTGTQVLPGLRRPGSAFLKSTDLMRGGLYCPFYVLMWYIYDVYFFFKLAFYSTLSLANKFNKMCCMAEDLGHVSFANNLLPSHCQIMYTIQQNLFKIIQCILVHEKHFCYVFWSGLNNKQKFIMLPMLRISLYSNFLIHFLNFL